MARIYVDFNEMVEPDIVLLSKEDTKLDEVGNVVALVEGQRVGVYCDDPDMDGRPARLIAEGSSRRNTFGGWTSAAKWVLKIDSKGIRRESEG